MEFVGVRPLHQSEFVWPDIIEIQALQQKYTSVGNIIPDTSVDKAGIMRNSKQAIWVPQEATSLQLRLMVIAHSACAGHRGINATQKKKIKINSTLRDWSNRPNAIGDSARVSRR